MKCALTNFWVKVEKNSNITKHGTRCSVYRIENLAINNFPQSVKKPISC